MDRFYTGIAHARMKRAQQRRFVRGLCKAIAADICGLLGALPEDWTGIELRDAIASEARDAQLSGSSLRDQRECRKRQRTVRAALDARALYRAVQGRVEVYDLTTARADRWDASVTRQLAKYTTDGLYRMDIGYVDFGGNRGAPVIGKVTPIDVEKEIARLTQLRNKPRGHARTHSPGVQGYQERENASYGAQLARWNETDSLLRYLTTIADNARKREEKPMAKPKPKTTSYVIKYTATVICEVCVNAKNAEEARELFQNGDFDGKDEQQLDCTDVEICSVKENT